MSPLPDECGPGSSPSDSPLPATLHALCSHCEKGQDAAEALPSLCVSLFAGSQAHSRQTALPKEVRTPKNAYENRQSKETERLH